MQHHRFLKIKIIILLIVLSVSCMGSEVNVKPETATTVILIRHAERDNFFVLTEEGRKRAKALIDAVGDMGISAIYSPNLERDLDTVKPLANHLGIEITLTERISKTNIDKIVGKILEKNCLRLFSKEDMFLLFDNIFTSFLMVILIL